MKTRFSLCLLAVPAFLAATSISPLFAQGPTSKPAMKEKKAPMMHHEPAGVIAPTAAEAKPVQPGAKIVSIELTDLEGKPVTITPDSTTLVVFFRGGWCPYCNVHLAELATSIDRFKEKGIRIVAISPDLPAELKKVVDKNELSYELYSDPDAKAMKAFGVAYKVPDQTMKNYLEKYELDLEVRAKGVLPVPSAFLVDNTGTVRFTHADVAVKERIKSDDIIAAADKIAAK